MAVRRDPFRDQDVTGRYVEKLGTSTARVFLAVVDRRDVDFMHMLALLAAAHHADLMRVAERAEPTYPSDVAELTGFTEERSRGYLGDLKRLGLLTGTAAAGYTLAGPLT